MVVTSTVLVGLVGLKVVIHPAWRASARANLTSCMHGHWSGRSADRVHRTGHLARCVTRLEPVHTDYLELTTAGLLVMVLVGGVQLLTHDHGATDQHRVPIPPTPGMTGPNRPEIQRYPGPRTSTDRSATDGRRGLSGRRRRGRR
jgi:hypothetical protein